MKRVLFKILLFGICIGVKAQNNWTGIVPVKMGYGTEFWTVNEVYNNFRYTQVNTSSAIPLDVANDNTFTIKRFPLVWEYIGENFHFSGSTTGAIDLLIQTISGVTIVGDEDTEALYFDLVPLQFGVGGWIKDRIGVFGGLNYSYTRISFSDNDVPDEIIYGGNTRGLNIVGMYAFSNLLVKSTLVYDWVSSSGGNVKGNSSSLDVEVYYSPKEKGNLGLWIGARFSGLSVSGPKGVANEDWIHKGIKEGTTYQFPDIKGGATFIRGGFYWLLGGRD